MNLRTLLSLAVLVAAAPAFAQETPAAETAAPAADAAAPAADTAAPTAAPENVSPLSVASAEPAMPILPEDLCTLDWKAFSDQISAVAFDKTPLALDMLGDAWTAKFACARRENISVACASVEADAAKLQKASCKQLHGAYDAALDKLELVSQEDEKEAERLENGSPSKHGALTGDYWADAGSPEKFGAGLQLFVRWYYAQQGAFVNNQLREVKGIEKRIFDIANDLDAADQLELTKEQKKAMKKEKGELEDKLEGLQKTSQKDGKRLAKESRKKLKEWTTRLKKDLKARDADKAACACPAR